LKQNPSDENRKEMNREEKKPMQHLEEKKECI